MNKATEERILASVTGYRRPYFATQPEYLYPGYRSTVKRAPTRPLVLLPHTLSEVTGPVFGYDDVKPTDSDVTRPRREQPAGRTRIDRDVAGQCSGTLSPRDRRSRRTARSEFHRRRPRPDRRRGPLPVRNDQAWRVSLAQPLQRVAARASAFLAVRAGAGAAPGDADVFPRRSTARTRSHVQQRARREGALPDSPPSTGRRRSDIALAYRYDIVLRGRDATPMETRAVSDDCHESAHDLLANRRSVRQDRLRAFAVVDLAPQA